MQDWVSWCFRSQRQVWTFPPSNSSVPITVSQTPIQTARISYVTFLGIQSHQILVKNWGERRAIRGEVRCNFLFIFCKLSCTIFKIIAEVCLLTLAKLQTKSGKPPWFAACRHLFSEQFFYLKIYNYAWLLFSFFPGTQRIRANMLVSH